ncbi:MAG: hypothetical protein ACSHYF_00360 [Verrucomicrobiaceae bacterium]
MKHLILFLTACGLLRAEMVFETQLVSVEAEPDALQVKVEFPFEIKGEPVTIVEYDAYCSCLSAKIFPLNPDRSTKLHWDVGEKGKVVGYFKLGSFKGTVEKPIALKLRGVDELVHLMVKVHIPVLVAIEPSTHTWEVGGALEEKVFSIKVQNDEPIHLTGHSGTNEGFPYEVKTIKEGREYELRVKPGSTETPGMGIIRLQTDCPIPRHSKHQIFVVVKAPRK